MRGCSGLQRQACRRARTAAAEQARGHGLQQPVDRHQQRLQQQQAAQRAQRHGRQNQQQRNQQRHRVGLHARPHLSPTGKINK